MSDWQPQAIFTDKAPPPAGHYSQAVRSGPFVFVSGQLPHLPDGSVDASADFPEQARRALQNMIEVLEAGGCALDQVVKVNAYIVGSEYWPAFNAVFAEMFGGVRPARIVVPAADLHFGYLVEVEAIAVVPQTGIPA